MDDLLTKIVPPFLVAFAVATTLGYLSKQARVESNDGQLRYGSAASAIGWLSLLITAGILFVTFFVDHDGQYVPLALMAAMFGFLGVWLVLETCATKGYFDDKQISISSFWAKTRSGYWVDLQEARFKKNGQCFEFLFSDGTKIQLSKILSGHRAVCQHVESLGVTIQDKNQEK